MASTRCSKRVRIAGGGVTHVSSSAGFSLRSETGAAAEPTQSPRASGFDRKTESTKSSPDVSKNNDKYSDVAEADHFSDSDSDSDGNSNSDGRESENGDEDGDRRGDESASDDVAQSHDGSGDEVHHNLVEAEKEGVDSFSEDDEESGSLAPLRNAPTTVPHVSTSGSGETSAIDSAVETSRKHLPHRISKNILAGKQIRMTDLLTMQSNFEKHKGRSASVTRTTAGKGTASGKQPRGTSLAQVGHGDYDEIHRLANMSKHGKRGVGRKPRKRKSDLPERFHGHMGQANLAYVQKDWDVVMQLCMEVITACPYVPEPYTTLAMVCAERGDMEASLSFRKLEATTLPKADVDWWQLGKLSVEVGDKKEALYFFNEARKRDPNNVQCLFTLARLYDEMDTPAKAFQMYALVLKLEPYNLFVWNRIAGYCTASFEPTVEQETLEANFAKCTTSRLTKEHIFVMATMWLKTGCAEKAIDVISSHMQLCCGTPATVAMQATPAAGRAPAERRSGDQSDPNGLRASIAPSSITPQGRKGNPRRASARIATPHDRPARIFTIYRVEVPTDLPHSFRLQLGLSHLHIQDGTKFAESILEPMQQLDPTEHFGTYCKIVDGFLAARCYRVALSFVQRMECTKKPISQYMKAQCYFGLEKFEQSLDTLRALLALIPDHAGAQKLLRLSERYHVQQKNAKYYKRNRVSGAASAATPAEAKASAPGSATVSKRGPGGSAADGVESGDGGRAKRPRVDVPLPRASTGTAAAASTLPNGRQVADIASDHHRFWAYAKDSAAHRKAIAVGNKLCSYFLQQRLRKRKPSSAAVENAFDCPPLPVEPVTRMVGRQVLDVLEKSPDGVHRYFDSNSLSDKEWHAMLVQLCVLLCKYHEFHDAMAIAHRALRSQSEGIFPHGRERNMLLWIKINCAEELGVGDDGGSSSTHWPPWEYADDDRLLSSSHISLYGACMVVSCSEGGVRDAIEYITGRMCSSTSCGCGCAGAGRGGASDSAAGIECTDVGVGVEQIPRDLQGPQQRQQHSAMDLTRCQPCSSRVPVSVYHPRQPPSPCRQLYVGSRAVFDCRPRTSRPSTDRIIVRGVVHADGHAAAPNQRPPRRCARIRLS
eukprot:m.641716 g.641716  ORF g.641716 m.641716 type:complete len:1109 (+) comp22631_c1_seq23:75-3401(+)